MMVASKSSISNMKKDVGYAATGARGKEEKKYKNIFIVHYVQFATSSTINGNTREGKMPS